MSEDTHPALRITPRRAVISPHWLFAYAPYKEFFLLYDELYVPGFYSSLFLPQRRELRLELEWLAAEGLIVEPPQNPLSQATEDDVLTYLARHRDDLLRNTGQGLAEPADWLQGVLAWDLYLTRGTMHLLWKRTAELTYAAGFPFTLRGETQSTTQQVLSIVLSHFPEPTQDTPIRELIAFKRDSSTRLKLEKLWAWVRKVENPDLNHHELEEEIRYLLTEYDHHLKLLSEGRKLNRMEILVTTPLKLLEDLVKLRWSEIPRAYFALKRVEIEAHKEEIRLPGSELALIRGSTGEHKRGNGNRQFLQRVSRFLRVKGKI